MRFQILSLLIIVSFINCTDNTFAFSSKTAGSCASKVYTFTVVGTVTAQTTAETTWTPTLTAPADVTATCTMPAVAASGTGTITCTITSALSSSDITLTKLEATGFTAVSIPSADQAIATGQTCEGTLNTFAYASKTEGSCENNEYSFTVTGAVTTQTSAATTWTPTFSAPTGASASCSMPAAATGAGNAVITCKITSALSNSAITLTKLTAEGFNAVNLSGASSTIATGKTCTGTSSSNPSNTSNPSDDGSKFISLNSILFSFFLLIF
jgi:hypothetical protein